MKLSVGSIYCCLVLAIPLIAGAEEVKTVEFGAATVIYDYRPAREGVATLSLNALEHETNNSLRGLRNSDRRRLGKLGQLIYQCKLLLYTPQDPGQQPAAETPMLVSRNYSLFTGVEQTLAAEVVDLEAHHRPVRAVRSLQAVDGDSLFTPTLGGGNVQREVWENVGDGSAIDLVQVNVNALLEADLIDAADNIDIILRFPIFQLQKPVREWSYNFDLRYFATAVRHVDENCTPSRLRALIDLNS